VLVYEKIDGASKAKTKKLNTTFLEEVGMKRVSLAFYGLGLSYLMASCGQEEMNESEVSGGQEGTDSTTEGWLHLSGATTSYCPAGTSLIQSHWLCASNTEAVGPFTPEMVQKCKNAGGGPACDGAKWGKSFAMSIRGIGDCMAGSTYDSSIDACVAGNDVYGPFYKTHVQKCKDVGGGSACEGMRWSKSFYLNVKNGGNPTPTPTPIMSQPREKVPHFYQMNNDYEPAATCGLTSTAMALSYAKGQTYDPDTLYKRYGKSQGQSPEGVSSVVRSEGAFAKSTRTGTLSNLKKHLDAGRVAVMNGYFTNSGHVVLAVGYNSTGIYFNDPAGDWYYGYFAADGKMALYEYSRLFPQVLSYDGDLWYTVVGKNDFQL